MTENKTPADDSAARLAALEERLKQITPPPKPEPVATRPEPLFGQCPLCGGEMEPGGVSIEGADWAFLLGEWHSTQELWFHPAGGAAKQKVVARNHPGRASRCRQCGFVGVQPQAE